MSFFYFLPCMLLVLVLMMNIATNNAFAASGGSTVPKDSPVKFRICTIDVPFAPYTKADGSGHTQFLIRKAGKLANIKFETHVAPRKRCLAEIKSGVTDGIVAAYTPQRAEYMVYPMILGLLDESKSITTVRFSLYHRPGATWHWDGKNITGLGNSIIGVESGYYFIDRLIQLKVNYDDGAKSVERNLMKLSTGRVDGTIAMELQADKVVAEQFAGQIERFPEPFEHTVLYLGVSKPFDAANPEVVDALWNAIREVRSSAEYRTYQQKNP